MTIVVSGGFDPLHVGHLDMIEAAAAYAPVIVVLNSDAWLIRKKGFVFIPWGDRARLLKAMRDVGDVSPVNDADGTVCEALKRIRPIYFANGGDRTTGNPKEHETCAALGIVELFGVGGGKIRSSSELVKRIGN